MILSAIFAMVLDVFASFTEYQLMRLCVLRSVDEVWLDFGFSVRFALRCTRGVDAVNCLMRDIEGMSSVWVSYGELDMRTIFFFVKVLFFSCDICML